MSKNKILIVEDEPIIASDIEMILQSLGYEITGIEDNAKDALQSIVKNTPDLVLLDINIEGDVDGVMLAQDINARFGIPFVYLTSNTDKMTINRVKRTQPAGFIVKPFSEQEIQSVVEIALFDVQVKEKDNTTHSDTYMFVRDGNSFIKLLFSDLMYLQADDNYSHLFTKDSELLLTLTLGKLQLKLPKEDFVRVHRSYIVNVNYVDKIQDKYLFIGRAKLPIGRSYQEDFFAKINKL